MFGSHRVCDRRIKRDGYVETEDQCVATEDLLLMVGSPARPNKPALPGQEQLCTRRFLCSDSTKLVIRFENWINWIKIITDIFRQLSMTTLIGGHRSMVMRVRVMF